MRLLVGQEDNDPPYYAILEEDVLLAIELVREQFTSYYCRGQLTMKLADELKEEICVYEGLLETIKTHRHMNDIKGDHSGGRQD